MSAIQCPVCEATAEPKVVVGTIAICGHCGASLQIDTDGLARRATGTDVLGLTAAELDTLRKARGRTR
jgi:transcription elongation factor Elf1